MTDLTPLTPGQRRVVLALLNARRSTPTYEGVAKKLGVSVGTVYRHLKRVREKHPELYHSIMLERKHHLAQRHKEALKRAEENSRRYFYRRYNRQYKEKYGFYPWERRGLIGRRGKR
jgi:transposase